MKVTTIFFILAIIIAPTFTLDSNSGNRILQASARTQSFTKMCATFSDRKSIVDQKSKTDAQANNASMYATFKITGNQLFSGIINNPDLAAGASSAIPNIQTGLGLFAGPFAIGLIILLLSWWFLCCCCCCPSCCPSKCCQKPDNQQYTKCQLFWPAITLILALLILIVASVIGITRASDIQSSYTAVTCSVAITADDLLNGNISTTGKYFLGMNNLISGLNSLKSNLGTVNNQIGKITYTNASGTLRLAYNEGTSLLGLVSQIPSGTAGGSMPSLSYKHFDGTGASTAVPSGFPTILGHTNPSGTGAVHGLHTALHQINQGLKLIGDNADTFSGQFGSLGGILDSALNPLSSLKDMLTGLDSSFSSINDSTSSIMNLITLVITAIFGVFIGLGVLSILGTVLMTFCDKYSCRYLVYFVCVILFILGIICFLLAFLFSIITPILYLGCDFINVSVSSPTAFNTNLGSRLGASIAPLLSVCLPGGSGDIINQIQGVNMSAITGLTSTISSMQSFSVSTLQNGVTTAFDTFESLVNQYYYTDLYDFNSPSDMTILTNLANPANYACTTNSFTQDSWVPSLRQTDIPCSVTSSQASATQCPNSAAVVGGRGTSTACFGCIDTTKVLFTTTTPAADITNRYTSTPAACGTWATAMNHVWTEYYSVKKTAIDLVKGRITSTRASYATTTTGYRDRIGAVGNSFTNIINSLQSVVSSIVDPNYGMVAGMNCLLLGQDINLISNTMCTKFFNTFYFLRLTLGLAAFGILFTMFCSTCSGVRAFKHSQRVGSILPKQMSLNQQQSTMAALNAKN